MEMLSESWIRNARHSRLALDERGSCLRTSICETGTSRRSGRKRGLISPPLFSCTLQIKPLSVYLSPSLVAHISPVSSSRRPWWSKSKHTPRAVDYYRSYAPLAILTIARATFDGTPNSMLKPRPLNRISHVS